LAQASLAQVYQPCNVALHRDWGRIMHRVTITLAWVLLVAPHYVHGAHLLRRNSIVNVIPQPQTVETLSGSPLLLGAKSFIRVDAPTSGLAQTVRQFVLHTTGPTSEDPNSDHAIRLQVAADNDFSDIQDLGVEGYCLSVSERGVNIRAKSEHGLFNGVMTLSQLPTPHEEAWKLPAVKICDQPAMAWRGLMVDVSRHFFSAAQIKRLLDTMALFKFNRFHWHLTDDQGWRVNVDDYPRLVEKGAWRDGTQIRHSPETNDHKRYGGFYSDDEVKDVVRHAQHLHIEVVPEIDMPGHTEAALAAYPSLGDGSKVSVATSFGPKEYMLSRTKESFEFAFHVLSKVMKLVPSSYVHIGGDETSHSDPIFTRKLSDIVTARQRTPIAWDEALYTGTLPKHAVVMVWRPDPDPRRIAHEAAREGHHVILAPQWFTYLDHPQDNGEVGHDSIGGDTLSLRKVYDFPLSDFGEPAPKGAIIGGQGQLWTEYIRTMQDLEYMAWPRGCALAEVFWSGEKRPGFANFRDRLDTRLAQLQHLGVGYRELGPNDRDDSSRTIIDQLGGDLYNRLAGRV